jgi:transcriptional regulator with XRE-family HTH domain
LYYKSELVKNDTTGLVERVRRNTQRLMRLPGKPKVTLGTLAKATGLSAGQLGNFLRGRYGIALKHLDPLARALGVPTSELVRETELPLYELTTLEKRQVEYLRRWTPEVREALLRVFDYLHGAAPEDDQTRQMLDYWRRLGRHERNVVFASAVRLSDEGLPHEVAAALGIAGSTSSQLRRRGKRLNEP